VFILQVFGSKLWTIEKERRLFPIRPYRMGDDGREFRGEVTSFTVNQGDPYLHPPRLHSPSGVWIGSLSAHLARVGPRRFWRNFSMRP